MNRKIDYGPRERGLIGHAEMRPDLSWPDLRIAIEHKGGPWHDDPDVLVDDDVRIQDYQTCGWAVFPSRFKDISSQGNFNRFALKICAAMARAGRPDIRDKVKKLLKDDDFLLRQSLMLAAALPPLTGYSDILS